ncbi:ABC transporter permease [Thalassoglobus polymorphus]|uniref:FtsX-like permease family protein n=1 Tax=Thalassoglobus polymorphus TaxID=2527994 RepID=A0A517QJM6_9PLAN|nr:ABC transporter permease [Thalassoglobus polymorphus]QDT31838.1 FtsX-like permease family protein [Thalassoglobus polymorphus]
MFRFIPYILKSLLRHRMRSLLTVSGSAVAIFVFCFVGSIQEGLERLTNGDDAQQSLIVFQENRFCPTTSRLPEDYSRTINDIPGVKDVVPMQVWTNNCRASLDIVVFNGAPPEKLKSTRDLKLVAGDWGTFEKQHDAALVGRNIAQRRGLKPGSSFTIGDITVNVAGVFTSPVAAEENLIYTNLEFLQYRQDVDSAGLVTLHEVYLTEGADPESVSRSIDEALRTGPVPTTTRRKGAFQASTLADLVDLIGFAHYLGYACVGLVLSIVATTTVMSVQDRIVEHAILQVMGVRPGRLFRFILSESTVLCFLGGLLGTGVAMGVLYWSGLAIGAEGVTIAFRPSLPLALSAIVVSILVGLAAGIIPAFKASRASIVMALQE